MAKAVEAYRAVDNMDPLTLMIMGEEEDAPDTSPSKKSLDRRKLIMMDFFTDNKKRYEVIKARFLCQAASLQEISELTNTDRKTIRKYLQEFRDALRRAKR